MQAPRSDRSRVKGEKGRHAHQNSPSSAFLSSSAFCLGSMSFHSGALGEIVKLQSLKSEAEAIIHERCAQRTLCPAARQPQGPTWT